METKTLKILVRQAHRADIPAMHRVRKAVRENKLSPHSGIDEASYLPYLETIGRGWVLEEDGQIVAFAIGERETGNIWAVFVHEDHEGKGYGKRVQAPMIDWLFVQGLGRIHLTTGAGTRAEGFYRATGWSFTGIDAHGDAAFERLRPGTHRVTLADPASPDARALLASLSATLEDITGSSGQASFDVADVHGERACFVVARAVDGTAVGCGALRPLQPGVAELKRMFAVPGTKGVGRDILGFLERRALAFGYQEVWLETRRVNRRALAFYERNGYQPISNYGRYIGRAEAVCLGKRLA